MRVVRDRVDGAWELPALGVVPTPSAVLIRPDGHVAWVGDGSGAGLTDALGRWFGVSDSGLLDIFPNLAQFDAAKRNLGFMV